MLPKGWTSYCLRDLLGEKGYVRGPFGSALRRPEMKEYGIPVYEQQHAIYNSRDFRFFIDKAKFKELSRFQVQTNDLIVSCSGTLGKISIIKESDPKGIISQALLLLRPDIQKVIPKFLQYHFSTPFGFNQLVQASYGSVQQNIASRKTVEDIRLKLPPLGSQERIIKILSSLDDKIELNLQINKTLEAIAQAIFKEWFVDFRFPGFDGELVDGLPKGWRNGKVSDTCIVNTNTLGNKDYLNEILYVEISEVEKGFIKNISTYKRGDEPSRAKRKLCHGDIVLSTVRPNRGSYFLAYKPENNLIASTGFAVFTATNVPYSFLYCFLTSNEKMDFYGRMADGAAYPSINPSIIMNMGLIIPTQKLLGLFNDTVGVIYEKIYENWKQNKILTQIRDSLLPRLTTGKIRTI